MNEGFIKNKEKLEEDYRVNDLLFFSEISESFEKKLRKAGDKSIIGLVGDFGCGKSTMLYQLYKDLGEDDNDKWIVFDAWKFPERKNLWEGFILEITRKIDKQLFEKARKEIDGKKYNDIKSLIKVLFQGANIFLPGASIGENFAGLFRSSPAKRIFEFQEILKEIINKIDKNLYIIIEDIDRSGDNGIYFLETLRYFLKENEFDNIVKIIVPIGSKKFEETKNSYLKSLDYIYNFNTQNIDFTNFIKTIFFVDLLKDSNNFIEHLNFLFKKLIQHKNATIRDIKHILRNANIEYQKIEDEEVDIRVLILFAVITHYKDSVITDIGNKKIFQYKFIGTPFLFLVASNEIEDNLQNYRQQDHIYIVNNNKLNIPNFISENEGKRGYYLSDKYLKYFS